MKVNAINAEISNREVSVADYTPFRSHVTENILIAQGGVYMRTWKVGGISFEAKDEQDIQIRHDGLNQLLRSIGDGSTAVWSHKIRRRVSDQLDGKFENRYCKEFNDRYCDSFAGYKMMAVELYLTVVYNPKYENNGITNFLNKAVPRSREQIAHQQKEAIEKLHEIGYQIEQSMQKYDLEALGTYSRHGVQFSKLLEFYGFLLNGFWEPIPLRYARINEYLPTSRLFFGNEFIEIRTPNETRFASVLDFSDYPEFTEPGILNPILYDDYEYIETQSFSIMNKRDAMSTLTRQKNQLIASEDVSNDQIRDIDTAIKELVNGTFVMGDYHYSLAVLGESMQQVAKNVSKARSSLQEQGFQTKPVDLVPDAAWWAQLPANWKYRPREAQISSRAFCGLSAFHNFASGKRNGNPWGEAVAMLKTPSGQPYYFNFHVTPENKDAFDEKALGNTMIIGQAGSGKTLLKMTLLAQATKFGATMILFDKDRGEEIAVRAFGGKYFSLKRGLPTGLAPFKLAPTKSTIMFWVSLVKKLVYHPTEPLTPTDESDIMHAVTTVASMDVSKRSISTVRQNLPSTSINGVGARLKKWCFNQELGWVLDCPKDLQNFNTHKIYGFDYTEFLDDAEIRTPLMMYLLYLTESQIDGRRFIYSMAEFWKPLADEAFSDFAKNKQKTIRKQNGLGIFDTQSPDDALSSSISRALIEQCSTFIFLANPRATKADYVEGFKLSEAEYEIVQSLGEASRMFLVKQGHQSAIAKLDLSGFGFDLDVLSGSTDNVELLDQIRAELNSDDPENWMPVLQERIILRRKLGKKINQKSLIEAT